MNEKIKKSNKNKWKEHRKRMGDGGKWGNQERKVSMKKIESWGIAPGTFSLEGYNFHPHAIVFQPLSGIHTCMHMVVRIALLFFLLAWFSVYGICSLICSLRERRRERLHGTPSHDPENQYTFAFVCFLWFHFPKI